MSHHESARVAAQPRPQWHLAPRRLQFPNAVVVLRQSSTCCRSGLQAQPKKQQPASSANRWLCATSTMAYPFKLKCNTYIALQPGISRKWCTKISGMQKRGVYIAFFWLLVQHRCTQTSFNVYRTPMFSKHWMDLWKSKYIKISSKMIHHSMTIEVVRSSSFGQGAP
jgi:hypothetical protein